MSGCTVLSHVSNTSTVEAHTDECVDIVCYHCGEKFSICNIHIKQVFERVDSRLLKSYGNTTPTIRVYIIDIFDRMI